MKRVILLISILATTLGVQASTVAGFVGETWLDHVDDDGFGGGNFGTGSQSNPYQISSAGALAYLARAVNGGETYQGKYFVIAANINLESPGSDDIAATHVNNFIRKSRESCLANSEKTCESFGGSTAFS